MTEECRSRKCVVWLRGTVFEAIQCERLELSGSGFVRLSKDERLTALASRLSCLQFLNSTTFSSPCSRTVAQAFESSFVVFSIQDVQE